MIAQEHSKATWVAALLALCGPSFGGAIVEEGYEAGFVKAFQTNAREHFRVLSVPASATIESFEGSLDLAATLASGRRVQHAGLLHSGRPTALLVRRLEGLDPTCSAAIAESLDSQAILFLGVCASGEQEDGISPRLTDRLAFHVAEDADDIPVEWDLDVARDRLPNVIMSSQWLNEIVSAGLAFGMSSPRPLLHAVLAARAIAALGNRLEVGEADAVLATQLLYAHRAVQIPPAETETPLEESQDQEREQEKNSANTEELQQSDVVVEAVKAAIPAGVLSSLLAGKGKKAAGRNVRGADMRKANASRGRRIGSKRSTSLSRQRLDILATLRTAAPWQALRRKSSGHDRMVVSRDDFRVVRVKRRNEATAIFVVDASGSTAFQRLAEAKGAVETVLAECYVRRDKAALISLRSKSAEVLLPPTRSLERAKRALTTMPGGGGTPLAAGLDLAYAVAMQVRHGGGTPTIVLMTDGRANVTRAGEGNKVKAIEESLAAAKTIAHEAIGTVLIDVSPDPQKQARALAEALGARYLPMPRAGALDIARPVQQLLRDAKS